MIKINYKTLEGEFSKSVPVTWRDITWAKFIELTSTKFESEIHRLAWLADIEVKILLNNPLVLNAFIETCQFIWTENIEENATYCPAKYKVLIKDLEWGKFEAAKSAIQSSENIWAAGAQVVKVYLDIDINPMSAVEAIGIVGFFLRK